ncbi:hypothetical protein ACQCT6_17275 [Cytobacillus gottheilii]
MSQRLFDEVFFTYEREIQFFLDGSSSSGEPADLFLKLVLLYT